jgi:hypothetical protein
MLDRRVLRPYQEKSLQILAKCPHGLDASDMGAGKTLVAVERLRHIPSRGVVPRVLVIAPVNTHQQWLNTFAGQYPSLVGTENLRIIGSPTKDPEAWKLLTSRQSGVYIVGWETMRGALSTPLTAKREQLRARVVQCVEKQRESGQKVDAAAEALDGFLVGGQAELTEIQVEVVRCLEQYTQDREQANAAIEALNVFLVTNKDKLEAADKLALRKKPTQQNVQQAIKGGLIPPWTRTGTWDLVVADEVHRLCNADVLSSKVIRMIKTTHRHGASGTPSGNDVSGLWGVANWLWPEQFRSFWRWAETWLKVEERIINSEGRTIKVITGEKAPGLVWQSLPCVVRHRTEDVVGQMPKVVEREVLVSMAPEQGRIYRELSDRAFAWLASDSLMTALPIEQRIRLRQAAMGEIDSLGLPEEDEDIGFRKSAPNPKIDMLKEIIQDLPTGEPVLVFTHSGKFARLVTERLGTRARLWSGAVTQKRREVLKEGFGRDFQILVAQTEAMAEGVDGLQHLCRCEVWLSESDNMIMNQQAKKRLHRPGQKHPVQRWYLRSEGTIDQEVHYKLLMRGHQMAVMYRDIPA